MSTSLATTQKYQKQSANPFRKLILSWQLMMQDLKTVRILRLSIATTLAMALAYAINWPLAMLTPVFTVVFLSLPLPRPNLRQGFNNMLQTLLAFIVGILFALYLLPLPFIFILMTGLAFFHIYYHMNRGGSFWLVLMLLISIMLMPMLANLHGSLAIGVSMGFVWSSWVAVWMIFLAHFLIPDPQSSVIPPRPEMHKGYVPVAAELALKSSLVAFPLAIFFIALQLTDYVLVMIFAAIFTLSPELSKGSEAIKKSLVSTLIGGVTAYCFYWLLVAVPEYYFFVLLTFFVSLVFAAIIFSQSSNAKYYSSALVAVIILFHGSMGENKDFTSVFAMRVILMSLAGVYVIMALKVLDSFWPVSKKH